MKPKPLEVLKNFTVPMVMSFPLQHRVPPARNATAVVETKHRCLGKDFGSSGAQKRVRKTEALRLTGRKNHVPRT